jgi:hypothetical protein
MRWEFIMTRNKRAMEEEELLSKKSEWDGEMEDDVVVQLEYSSPPPGDILREVVKKRKFEGFPRAMEEKRVRHTTYKTPMSRVCEYMVLHGRSLATIPEEPVTPGIQLGHLSTVSFLSSPLFQIF